MTLRTQITGKPKRKVIAPVGRISCISKLMALAIHFQQLLDDGVVEDQSDLARLSHVTQPRITQIMNLLLLAPEIQEEILHLPKVLEGKDPIHEKLVRPVAAEVCFEKQLKIWKLISRSNMAKFWSLLFVSISPLKNVIVAGSFRSRFYKD